MVVELIVSISAALVSVVGAVLAARSAKAARAIETTNRYVAELDRKVDRFRAEYQRFFQTLTADVNDKTARGVRIVAGQELLNDPEGSVEMRRAVKSVTKLWGHVQGGTRTGLAAEKFELSLNVMQVEYRKQMHQLEQRREDLIRKR